MIIKMDDSRITSLAHVREFNNFGSCSFKIEDKAESYKWIETNLLKFRYFQLDKNDKGSIREYLHKITSYSQQQLTRLIKKYSETGKVSPVQYTRVNPNRKYTPEDIELIAQTDKLHNNPSGPALVKTLKRMFTIYKDQRFVNKKSKRSLVQSKMIMKSSSDSSRS